MSKEPIKFEPEVISLDTSSRRVLVFPDNYQSHKFEYTDLHFVRVSDGEVFHLSVKSVLKLIRALKNWGYGSVSIPEEQE